MTLTNFIVLMWIQGRPILGFFPHQQCFTLGSLLCPVLSWPLGGRHGLHRRNQQPVRRTLQSPHVYHHCGRHTGRAHLHFFPAKVKQTFNNLESETSAKFFCCAKKTFALFLHNKKSAKFNNTLFFLISYLKKIISWSMLLVRLLWYICKLNRFVGLDFNAKLCLKHLHCTLKVSGCHQSYCDHLQLISTMFSLTWESKGSSFFTNFRNCSLVSLLSSPW